MNSRVALGSLHSSSTARCGHICIHILDYAFNKKIEKRLRSITKPNISWYVSFQIELTLILVYDSLSKIGQAFPIQIPLGALGMFHIFCK